ncbi:MAG TPA: Fe-Mn family superoxide dismutase [archaeon]|nr:Fe-Mn family superoxide dismutase [archaeon]
MPYETKNYDHLIGTPGFSEQILKNHFTLYQGYVNNTNKVVDDLNAIVQAGRTSSTEFAELKRRFAWEFNGMRLHEFYFGNMSKETGQIDRDSLIFKAIVANFGSYENWAKDFRSVGSMRGVGWATLCYDPQARRLFNVWINEHDAGHLAGAVIILIMDVFEHAYMLDYGVKRADYIEAFLKVVDWNVVQTRFSELPRK